jgi:hypothetical protein
VPFPRGIVGIVAGSARGGVNGFNSNNIRVGRAAAFALVGSVAEAGIWATSTNSTVRGNLNTNKWV